MALYTSIYNSGKKWNTELHGATKKEIHREVCSFTLWSSVFLTLCISVSEYLLKVCITMPSPSSSKSKMCHNVSIKILNLLKGETIFNNPFFTFAG